MSYLSYSCLLQLLQYTIDTFIRAVYYFQAFIDALKEERHLRQATVKDVPLVLLIQLYHINCYGISLNRKYFLQIGNMFFVVFGWAVKNLIYLTINCIQSEKFYIMIEKSEEACLQLMKNSKYSSK